MAEFGLEHGGKPDKKREELKGKVIRLPDLVDYAGGTVASRMVINRKSGSVTIFSFDENEGLSEHTAPFDAMVTILDGECEVWVAGKTFPMKTGETIIFPAGVTARPLCDHEVQDEPRDDQRIKKRICIRSRIFPVYKHGDTYYLFTFFAVLGLDLAG